MLYYITVYLPSYLRTARAGRSMRYLARVVGVVVSAIDLLSGGVGGKITCLGTDA